MHLIDGMVGNLFFMKANPVYYYYKEITVRPKDVFIDYILFDNLTIDTYRHNTMIPWIKRPLQKTQIEIADLSLSTPQLIYDQKQVVYSPYFKRFMSHIYTMLSDIPILLYVKEEGQEELPWPIYKKGPIDISWKYKVDNVINIGLENYEALLKLLNSNTCKNRDNSDKSRLSLYLRKGNKVIHFDDFAPKRRMDNSNKDGHLIYRIKLIILE